MDLGGGVDGPASGSSNARIGNVVAQFTEKLKRMDTSQASINGMSQFILHAVQSTSSSGRPAANQIIHAIVAEWLKLFQSNVADTMLLLIYVANDVLQQAKRHHGSSAATQLNSAFGAAMPRALAIIGTRGLSIIPKVRRVLNVWREREVFTKDAVDTLDSVLDDPDSILAVGGTEEDDAIFLLGSGLESSEPQSPAAANAGAITPKQTSQPSFSSVAPTWETGFGMVTEVGGEEAPPPSTSTPRATSLEHTATARPSSPLMVLERELLPAVAASVASMRDGVKVAANAVSQSDLSELVSALSDGLIRHAQEMLSACDASEVAASLSADDAIAASRAASTAIIVDPSDVQLHPDTIEMDPKAQRGVVQRHLRNLDQEMATRQALIASLTALLEAQASNVTQSSTATAFGRQLTDEEQIQATRQMLSNVRNVRKRVEERVNTIQSAKRSRLEMPARPRLEPGQVDVSADDDDSKFFREHARSSGEAAADAKALLSAVLASANVGGPLSHTHQAPPRGMPPPHAYSSHAYPPHAYPPRAGPPRGWGQAQPPPPQHQQYRGGPPAWGANGPPPPHHAGWHGPGPSAYPVPSPERAYYGAAGGGAPAYRSFDRPMPYPRPPPSQQQQAYPQARPPPSDYPEQGRRGQMPLPAWLTRQAGHQ